MGNIPLMLWTAFFLAIVRCSIINFYIWTGVQILPSVLMVFLFWLNISLFFIGYYQFHIRKIDKPVPKSSLQQLVK